MTHRAVDIPAELVVRAREGDDAALAELVKASAQFVRRWALVQMGDVAEADDLTQDVLIRMIQNTKALPDPTRFAPWLYRVTRNAATDRFRRRVRWRADADPDDLVSASADPEADAAGGELRRVLHGLFRDLPRRQREVFDLVELQGIPANDVAVLLRIRPASVRANLFKARRNLRRRILSDHPELAEERP